MSVLLETSVGDLVIDLETKLCPTLCLNFLKLCKVYYYNLNLFFNVSKDFIAQTGDPSATGTGGESIWSYLAEKDSKGENVGGIRRYFEPEMGNGKLKHRERGTVSMAIAPGEGGGCGSQFFITLKDSIEYLDGKHAVFGRVVEGLEGLDEINGAFVDQEGRPLRDIRIRHVVVLEDPYDDPPNLTVPLSSPTILPDANPNLRIADSESYEPTLSGEELEAQQRAQAASAAALTLEMIGDLPFANVRPPENILFVCKLNSVTRDEDLELIFSRFGKIMSCEVIRDKISGDSLQYAFIEFDKREDAEMAYFKMQNVLVDDKRIWVDFSQSVSKMGGSWSNAASNAGRGGGRGGRGGRGGYGSGRGGRDGGEANRGFGGRDDLVSSSKYRANDSRGDAGSGRNGGMVFDLDDRRSGNSNRRRSRSPSRRGEDRRDSRSYREDDRRNDDRRDRDRDGRDHGRNDRDRYRSSRY